MAGSFPLKDRSVCSGDSLDQEVERGGDARVYIERKHPSSFIAFVAFGLISACANGVCTESATSVTQKQRFNTCAPRSTQRH
jgi:hypothetical protein